MNDISFIKFNNLSSLTVPKNHIRLLLFIYSKRLKIMWTTQRELKAIINPQKSVYCYSHTGKSKNIM